MLQDVKILLLNLKKEVQKALSVSNLQAKARLFQELNQAPELHTECMPFSGVINLKAKKTNKKIVEGINFIL